MGTLSLIFGLLIILVGLGFLGMAVFLYWSDNFVGQEHNIPLLAFTFGIAIIILAGGSALIIKYDNDKKKEKNS